MESKLIVESINLVINRFKNYKLKEYRTEALLQFQLYHNICNKFYKEFGIESYKRILAEYSPFETKNLDKYASKLKQSNDYLPYMENIYNPKKYKINLNIKPESKKKELADAIVKQGKYDIVIFNEDLSKIRHFIEVKKLKEHYIYPEGAERHRALEDIYELSDFINEKNYKKNIKKEKFNHDFSKIPKLDNDFKKARGYNLMYVCEEWNWKPLSKQNEEKMEKITFFLNDIKVAYEKSGIYYLAIGIDKNLEQELDDFNKLISCGDGKKYENPR
jgi:hypothetical protein